MSCAVLADLLEVASAREAVHAALDHEQADAGMARGGIGLHGGDHKVGVDPVGDEGLGAVDEVAVAVALRARGDRRKIRAGARLGHRDRGDQRAARDPRQPALALLVTGIAREVRQADVVVQGDSEAERGDARVLRLLADHRVQAEVLRARAAEPFGDLHRQEAPGAGLLEDLARHDPGAFPLAAAPGVADDLAFEEGAKARTEILVEIIEALAAHRGTLSPASWGAQAGLGAARVETPRR